MMFNSQFQSNADLHDFSWNFSDILTGVFVYRDLCVGANTNTPLKKGQLTIYVRKYFKLPEGGGALPTTSDLRH